MSYSEDSAREAYIRRNSSQIVPLIKWLARTVVKLEQPVASRRKNRRSEENDEDDDDERMTSSDRENTILFSLNCILYVSAAATGDAADQAESTSGDELCSAICDDIDFLWHLNFKLYSARANDSHLGILV